MQFKFDNTKTDFIKIRSTMLPRLITYKEITASY